MEEISYVGEIYEGVVSQSPGEPEFHQAAKEVLDSLRLVIGAGEEKYHKAGILEHFTRPECIVSFRIPWMDDSGRVQVSKGYRVQFNSTVDSCKGGLRFHPSVNQSIPRFFGFEQTLENSLTGLPMDGGKGGSNFDPRGESDRGAMTLCQNFTIELYHHVGKGMDTPTGDIGVDGREVGYLFGQHKRVTGLYEGVLISKGLTFGGSLTRVQTTGYDLVYMLDEMLEHNGKELAGKTVFVSGPGNVAIYVTEKTQQLGAKVVALNGSSGYIYDENDVRLDIIEEIKEVRRARIREYVDAIPTIVYTGDEGAWTIPCDIALSCATQNELNLEDTKIPLASDCFAAAGGANIPSILKATELFAEKKVLFMPGKAANAGGVVASGPEQSQNALRMSWSFEEVDGKFHTIMINIFAKAADTAEKYGVADNYVVDTNITGFEEVIEAMPGQGIV